MAWSTLTPPGVSMELHVSNREKLLKSIRQHLTDSSRPLHGVVLLQGGDEQTRYCTDHIELFRQESYFAYLFGVIEPGFYGAIDIASGKSVLFAPRLPADYAVWLGEIKPLSYFQEKYTVSMVYYTDEIVVALHDIYKGSGKPLLYLLHGLNTDSNNFSKPAEFKGIEKFETDLTTLHPILTECRVAKSEHELALIQFANDISSEAHVEVMRKIRPGMKEYQLESIFLHHTYMYGGCRHCSYTCICATGENSAVLHYGHAAAPNDRTLEDGDMALFDMGAEYHFYGSDITCSFPVNGKFTSDQSLIYNAVLNAHNAVISAMKPGISWVDMHKLAEKIILESLNKEDIIVGNVDEMMAERLGAVFMPHGLGHLLGIDTHDPGGFPKGMERPKEPGLRSLRTVRVLQEKMVITVEPGCYFIDALLVPAMENAKTSKFFNGEVIDRFKKFGGVRIESDVLVTTNGSKNMTNCPREVSEIEAVMAGASWPLKKT
ncbi:Peptidase_M24 domain-containing protein/AMP_N domain-containing protein [Cephalotus follicularis]|uniref:Xaa-Pro dipeptidase n=1 Tax=Cephalotus follicularis TaxID=3775 RepID=A0A1Q3BKP0_CEPFO|nr:Peptidase_M24 domain-containing protein/AMP_N domain-containing protein [Cephalotus follicularis]